eukprot:TRINITY_DN351_c0_g1_i2.p1 TRINITY_DN351_c0_g1~~TRINITY_DN351_c0_g1_i2.p1  ORF type:complete len:162 (-),score=13.75 TRINITY_DN351_c0_g1_i2:41-526(-)
MIKKLFSLALLLRCFISKEMSIFKSLVHDFRKSMSSCDEGILRKQEYETVCTKFINQCEKAFENELDKTFCRVMRELEVDCQARYRGNPECYTQCAKKCSTEIESKQNWVKCYGNCGICHPSLKKGEDRRSAMNQTSTNSAKSRKNNKRKSRFQRQRPSHS